MNTTKQGILRDPLLYIPLPRSGGFFVVHNLPDKN